MRSLLWETYSEFMTAKNEMNDQSFLLRWNLIWKGARAVTKRRGASTKCAAGKAGAKENNSANIISFMPCNQSFNQSLYAPLTRPPLVCRPAVYFMRKVDMKRRPILQGILSAGGVVQLALLLCTAPTHAQSGLVPGMQDPGGGNGRC